MAATEGVNSDLVKERQNATFDVDELSNFIYRGPDKVKRRKYLRKSIIANFDLSIDFFIIWTLNLIYECLNYDIGPWFNCRISLPMIVCISLCDQVSWWVIGFQ